MYGATLSARDIRYSSARIIVSSAVGDGGVGGIG